VAVPKSALFIETQKVPCVPNRDADAATVIVLSSANRVRLGRCEGRRAPVMGLLSKTKFNGKLNKS